MRFLINAQEVSDGKLYDDKSLCKFLFADI